MPEVPSGCEILYTEAGLPLTSMPRRSSRSTVCAAPLVSTFARGSVCERASVVAAEVAMADKKNARRDSIEASQMQSRRWPTYNFCAPP
jgi:hypothetical protein